MGGRRNHTGPSDSHTKRPLSQTTHVDFKQKIILKHSAFFIRGRVCLVPFSEFLYPWIDGLLHTFSQLLSPCESSHLFCLSCVRVPNSPQHGKCKSVKRPGPFPDGVRHTTASVQKFSRFKSEGSRRAFLHAQKARRK